MLLISGSEFEVKNGADSTRKHVDCRLEFGRIYRRLSKGCRKIMLNQFHQKFHQPISLFVCTLLLGVSLSAQANDFQDANKLFKQGQRSQALVKVNNYLASKPKDAKARFLKGLILTEQGEITDAINIFSSLTADYPELPEPYNNLAVLYANQGQYDNAKLSLEMAIRTHPSYATAHENLGDIYARMASQAYDRALQLDRSNTATQTKLAMIQELFAGGTRGKESTSLRAPWAARRQMHRRMARR